jgi:hypothetical protein
MLAPCLKAMMAVLKNAGRQRCEAWIAHPGVETELERAQVGPRSSRSAPGRPRAPLEPLSFSFLICDC